MSRAVVKCTQCGQSDDHPKVHAEPAGVFHHDCLPYELRAQVSNDQNAKSIVEAAESGIHGDDLLKHIADLHAENGS